MSASLAFLRFVAKAALNHVGFGVGGDFAVEVLPEIARAVWGWWGQGRSDAQLRCELQEVALLSPVEVKSQTAQVAAEVAAQHPEKQQELAIYLSLIPSAIRRSLRRPSDPTGTTIPDTLPLSRHDHLMPFLPLRPPHFQPGVRPIPNIDLELVELLGVGGFGEVWEARNPRLANIPPVALKFCLDPEARTRLLGHEAAVLNRVIRQGKCAGIVELRHTYLDADPPCLEYEFVEGGDLTGLIRDLHERRQMTPDLANSLLRQLAETIAHAHRAEPPIVHCDLKPANILVRRQADGKFDLLVTDFGIGGLAATRAVHEKTQLTRSRQELLTEAVRGAYTPLYASPEQMTRGKDEPADPRDDVHALGVIWYQLLTGNLEMTSIPPEWREQVEERGLDPGLVRLLGSCISSTAEKRPASAVVLADRLSALPPPLAGWAEVVRWWLTHLGRQPNPGAAAVVIAQLNEVPCTEVDLIRRAQKNAMPLLGTTRYTTDVRCGCPALHDLAGEGRVKVEKRNGVNYYSLPAVPPAPALPGRGVSVPAALKRAAIELQKEFGDAIPGARLKERAHELCGYPLTSIIPSDFCYNRKNKGSRKPEMFLWKGEGLYQYVGEGYLYKGEIIQEPRESLPPGIHPVPMGGKGVDIWGCRPGTIAGDLNHVAWVLGHTQAAFTAEQVYEEIKKLNPANAEEKGRVTPHLRRHLVKTLEVLKEVEGGYALADKEVKEEGPALTGETTGATLARIRKPRNGGRGSLLGYNPDTQAGDITAAVMRFTGSFTFQALMNGLPTLDKGRVRDHLRDMVNRALLDKENGTFIRTTQVNCPHCRQLLSVSSSEVAQTVNWQCPCCSREFTLHEGG
jgi:hypothetical protein